MSDDSRFGNVLDRYGAFTDVAILKEWSSKPLRKSIRVNTLKTSVEAFQAYAKERGWMLTEIPWCRSGFFIDREHHDVALGRDLRHLLGHFYMQEAASMLPPALLDPGQGAIVLDLCAAPGSKTTQIAAMTGPRGIILGNDVQEKRLWTLKSSIHRMGVPNVIVTKKVGQWFARNMTERFDGVLCDAPCTAQGTARKDSDALQYCGIENIARMAKLQKELLESAIDATKVGGRIVYSTCTLSPEENEGVILHALRTFAGKVECRDPTQLLGASCDMHQAKEDSDKVYAELIKEERDPSLAKTAASLRLWPQTYDTEGFFCAVLEKTAPTRHPEHRDPVCFQEEPLPHGRMLAFNEQLRERFGYSFLTEDDAIFQREDRLILSTARIASFHLPVEDYALGMPFAKRLSDDRIILDHDFVTLRGANATLNVLDLDDDDLTRILKAQDASCPIDRSGPTIIRHNGVAVGLGLAKGGTGILKNNLPRWMVRFD